MIIFAAIKFEIVQSYGSLRFLKIILLLYLEKSFIFALKFITKFQFEDSFKLYTM